MDVKTELVNSLVLELADRGNLTIQDVKVAIIPKLYNYNVTEITNTELSTKDGTTTIYRLYTGACLAPVISSIYLDIFTETFAII